ncbi:alpha/beta-hydrolase [Pleomassaria siparia CBS 279.74]|uniref:Alpha/beta-hydrolase n=1 Tax=Pleomassaria siparia CBS 279.74 TaxID=1314801 RepID=A0A6G1KMB7_9PLEO|nr:alpha/beta-hydrolase [Pleomassaria siparia CBS 279.74]
MKLVHLSSLALAAQTAVGGVLSTKHASYNTSQQLTVSTSTGTYTGLIDPKFPNTRQFRSIAFAEPPVLSRRWLPPQKLAPSNEHHNSFDLPLSCPQFMSAVPSLLGDYYPDATQIFNGNQSYQSGLSAEATSEDCLYLAVWTPANATITSKLPVLFFMYGGGFSAGGVSVGYTQPMGWVERSQSHIVVEIQYRLNILGYPNARGLVDQNLGLLDQRMALEWVRDNIAQFGGDAASITQMGQSAGSMSIDAHAHVFYKDPIARAYFMMSGTLFSGSAVADTAYSNFSFVASHFGCGADSNDGVAELDCMRQVPFDQLENFIGQYGDNGTQPALSFVLAVDERTIFSDYPARIQVGEVARLPSILSSCANEASSLVPFNASDPYIGYPQSVVDAVTLAGFVCPAYKSTVERNQLNVTVYRYQHAGVYPNMSPFEWVGAYHGSDIPMVFGTYGLVGGEATDLQAQVSVAMQDHVLAFAKDPLNGPQKLGWKPMVTTDSNGGQLLRFGADGKAVQYINGLEVDGVCQGLGEYDAFP